MSDHLIYPNTELLVSATGGFDFLFSNNIVAARQRFAGKEDPFHILSQGVCAFLEADLGMEVSGSLCEVFDCKIFNFLNAIHSICTNSWA
jgi:hypothetical protein